MKRFSLSGMKDAALEKAVLMFLRPKVERYGEIQSFSIDSRAKVLAAEIRLRGDDTPLVISEAHYRIEQKGDQAMLVVYGVKASREWVQNILEDHLPEISMKVPEFVKTLIA